MRLKFNLKSLLIYTVYAVCAVFANRAVNGIPLSAGLFFSMLLCGTNIFATPVIFVLSSVVNLNLRLSLIALFQAVFLTLVTFLYRRSGRKIKAEVAVYIAIALAPYVLFAPWLGAEDLPITNPYLLKLIASAVVVPFGFFCFKSVYALIYRLNRCRLKEEELICLAVVFTVCGSGFFSLCGAAPYYCFAALALTVSVRCARSPSALIAAIVCALPPAVGTLSLMPITALVIICTLSLLFAGAGRFASGLCCGALTALYMYYENCFFRPVPLIVLYALLLFLAVLLPSLPSPKKYEELKRRLQVTEVLPQTALQRSQMRTGEKLYRISEVFREIECSFLALDEDLNDESARARILKELKDKCCGVCDRCKKCEHTTVYSGFKLLIEAGCIKGRVNLIDLPSEITLNCAHPTELLSALNTLLSEYRRSAIEKENARSGRRLLAEQARGVAEVMKDCAVELSRTRNFGGAAELVKKALAAQGICCPEVYVDDLNEVCVLVMGKAELKAMCAIISEALGRRFILKDKTQVDGDKRCLIFSAPPKMDAVFGMAYAIKSGEKVSGDTHSVIRINERKFLMVLSDGMGSGEYARKVSESAISLIEAFYRAEMPEDTVLNTVNKLLSFNRDERFTCIDVACVNLDSGRADFVKIGSPAGVIMRDGEIKILESNSLPMGILDNLKPATCTERLKSGDIIVFMSDGITSAFPSSTELYEFLRGFNPLNPQSLADKILAGALDNAGHVISDDMTVLCTRIYDNE